MRPEVKRKKTFGTIAVAALSPDVADGWPKSININLRFEEALKLHLGLGQLLGHLNTYNRSTKEARRATVNLCLFPRNRQVTINEGRLPSAAPAADAE